MAFETDHSIGSCFANGYVSGSLVYDTDTLKHPKIPYLNDKC